MKSIWRNLWVATFGVIYCMAFCSPARSAQTIYTIGAFDPTDSGETDRQLYTVNPTTGVITLVAAPLAGEPAGLAGAPDGRLLALNGDFINLTTQLLEVNKTTGAFTNIGSVVATDTYGFDILPDGRAFTIPAGGTNPRQLHGVDLTTGVWTPIGPALAIETAFVNAGEAANQSMLVNNLGSVGNTLYSAVRYGTNRNLVAINPDTGIASLVGALNALNSNGTPGGTGLTGYDSNNDGINDTLYGIRNKNGMGEAIGGIGTFDLVNGTFTVMHENTGYVFSGMGAVPVPEPSTLLLAGLALPVVWWGHRRRRLTVGC